MFRKKAMSQQMIAIIVALLIGLALAVVLLVGGVGKVALYLKGVEPTCGALGIEGKCGCLYTDNSCPGDTTEVKTNSCPPDNTNNAFCKDAKKFKKALSVARADSNFGNCCVKPPQASILD